MSSDNFEQAFSNFLDRQEYDEAEGALFAIVRAAFLAGWNAAGGTPPTAQPVLTLLHTESQSKSVSKNFP